MKQTIGPNGINDQSQAVGEQEQIFLENMELVRKSHIRPLPYLADCLNHEGLTTKFDAGYAEPGLYLDPTRFPSLEEMEWPDRLAFKTTPMSDVGRENSQHSVFSGNLAMSWFSGSNTESAHVVVKPSHGRYSHDYQKSLHEIAMHQHLERLGVPTLRVLGMLAVDSGREDPDVFPITADEKITTLDNIKWRSLSLEQRWKKVGVALDVEAALSRHLVFQGEPEFRNVAFRQTEGDICVIDLEDSVSALYLTHPSKVHGHDRIRQCMSNEFSRIGRSVDEFVLKPLPEDERPNNIDRFELLVEYVFVPYWERLARLGSSYLSVLKRELDQVIDRKMLEATGEL